MKQQSVYLHTKKELGYTINILKEQGMEIIFKSSNADLQFSDLTSEEKASFIEIMAEDLSEHLKYFEKGDKDVKKLEKKLQSYWSESVAFGKLLRSNPNDYKTNEKYASFSKMNLAFGHSADRRSMRYYRSMSYYEPLSLRNIRCSVLLAKKGTETVRYVSFLKDPVLTITGPKAAKLKSSLESKF